MAPAFGGHPGHDVLRVRGPLTVAKLNFEKSDKQKAELLTPEPAVRDPWKASHDVSRVASRLGVSGLAARWRLDSLGLSKRPG